MESTLIQPQPIFKYNENWALAILLREVNLHDHEVLTKYFFQFLSQFYLENWGLQVTAHTSGTLYPNPNLFKKPMETSMANSALTKYTALVELQRGMASHPTSLFPHPIPPGLNLSIDSRLPGCWEVRYLFCSILNLYLLLKTWIFWRHSLVNAEGC